MIEYIFLLLLLLYLISKLCYNEYFENKIEEYYITIQNGKYIFNRNDNKLIESIDNNLNESIKCITKNIFNNNYDDIILTKSKKNKYTYQIMLKKNDKERILIVERDDYNKYNIYNENNEIYCVVYRSIINNLEYITIRNTDISIKYVTIYQDSKNSNKYIYKSHFGKNELFKNEDVLAYAIFVLIKEINLNYYN